MRRFVLPAFLVLTIASLVCAAPTTAPSGTGSIKGSLVKDGQPLANITVRLMQRSNEPATDPSANGQGAKSQRNGPGARRGTLIAQTTTDADGNFNFANLAAGNYLVVARDRATNVGGLGRVTVADSQSATVSITAKERKAKDGKKHKK